MMYPFMTLNDGTEVVHSEAYMDDGKEKMKVYFEKPIDRGFESAYCYLPEYRWDEVTGFDKDDIDRYQEFLSTVAHIIIEPGRQGGIEKPLF